MFKNDIYTIAENWEIWQTEAEKYGIDITEDEFNELTLEDKVAMLFSAGYCEEDCEEEECEEPWNGRLY